MASVRVDEDAFGDLRFAELAEYCGLADADHARGRMLWLWRECTRAGTYLLTRTAIDSILGKGGTGHLIQARLGTEVGTRIRIHGTEGRIEWLANQRAAASKGGASTRAKWEAERSASRKADRPSDPRADSQAEGLAERGPIGLATGQPRARPEAPPNTKGVGLGLARPAQEKEKQRESLSSSSSTDSGSTGFSELGSAAVSAPDLRPTERSSAAARRGYPAPGATAVATPSPAGGSTGAAASGDAAEPAPRAPVLPPGSVLPDPEYQARQAAVARVWERLNSIRAEMALEFAWRDVRPLHLMDPGVAELNARLRELGASGEETAMHVLACAAAEAKSSVPPTVRWLAGSLFGAAQWRRYSAMRVADAVLPPRGTKRGAPAPEYAAAAAAAERERQRVADRERRAERIADEESKADVPMTDEDRAALRDLARKVARNPEAVARELRADPDVFAEEESE